MRLPVFNPLFLASWIAPGWAPLEAEVCALDGVTWWEQTVTDRCRVSIGFFHFMLISCQRQIFLKLGRA